jgi:hypothetical protein
MPDSAAEFHQCCSTLFGESLWSVGSRISMMGRLERRSSTLLARIGLVDLTPLYSINACEGILPDSENVKTRRIKKEQQSAATRDNRDIFSA